MVEQRARMDWVLFGTIVGLASAGLVMVYSASSVMPELRARALEQRKAKAEAARPDKEAPPKEAEGVDWRAVARKTGTVVLAVACPLFFIRRYRRQQISRRWLAAALAATALLTLVVWFHDPGTRAHYAYLSRQAGAALLGLLLMMALSQRDYRTLDNARAAFLGLSLTTFLLILAYFFGRKSRFLDVGISLQPSELAKPVLVVFLAWFVTRRATAINSPHTFWPAAFCLLVVCGLVGLPDLGTALVLIVTAAVVFYLAGLNRWYTLTAVALGVVLLFLIVVHKPYRLKRVIDFVDPQYNYLIYVDPGKRLWNYAEQGTANPETRYHVTQSRLAVGSGGVTGRGVMRSRQKLLFLPEAHTDFIYAVLAEETGLIGAVLTLGAYMIIFWRGLRLYWTASDDFGRYLAAGVTVTIVFQALLNMSVVLDLGPTKGIPLPLVSFGGSSMVGSMILFGLLLSVSQRAQAH